MQIDRIISHANLELAWRRITTGANYQYKRYFREIYYAYETALDKNLEDLHERLKGGGGSYRPQHPTRVYIPKPSGLQRPLTLLSIEDQIILQAIANHFEKKLAAKRSKLQFKTVFSNILQEEKDSIFFLKDWHVTYDEFQKKIQEHFAAGLRWIAHFDLAAFYDTISHDLLLRMLDPKAHGAETGNRLADWLSKWSSEKTASAYGHGIPQGPIASDFLAECFLLPIDQVLTKEFTYVRYVDDIRLFASSKMDAQRAAIRLEVLCRDRGLIPQGKKFNITEAKTIEDAMGMLPSIAPPNNEEADEIVILSAKKAVESFRQALSENGQKIADKTRARYVLYHAEQTPILLAYVLKFLPRHPEHTDAFIYYLSQYAKSEKIVRTCCDYLRKTPYEYVQGELWHILARMMSKNEMRRHIKAAVNIAKDNKGNYSVKWGACHFLCRAEREGLGNYARFVKFQSSALMQALLVPILPDNQYKKKDVIAQLLKRSSFEPGIMLAEQFTRRKITHLHFGVRARNLPTQVQNVYRAVNIIRRSLDTTIDPVGEILSHRYDIAKWTGWKTLFGAEYRHALQILCQADPVFDSGRSRWLRYQNSFNDALFRSIQKHLEIKKLPGVMKLTHGDGKLINFGALVAADQQFAIKYPVIAEAFREANARRNTLPGSHPYNIKGGAKTQHLSKSEQTQLVIKLTDAYIEITKVFAL